MPILGTDLSAEAHWTVHQAAVVGNITEANAYAAFTSTGRIQIALDMTAGTVTAGEITAYIQLRRGDAVYTIMPTAQVTAIAATDQIRAPIDLGAPSHYKLVITNLAGAGGGPSFQLLVRDAHV